MSCAALLTIDRVSVRYPGVVQALDGVSLAIGRGVFGLLGPNGAGKSTLMRILATLQQADRGEVRFAGLDLRRDQAAVREQLGYLPQDFGLYPRLSAERLLDHVAVLKGITERRRRRAEVERLLVRTNLWALRRRPLGALSGGMRQRFGIAQALLGSPRLVIVDEPTAGLDPEERVRFLDLLVEVGESAVVLLSTHLTEDVATVCGEMAVLSDGRVLLAAEPREAMRRLQGRLWAVEVARGELAALGSRCRLVSHRLVGGRTIACVASSSPPGAGFAPVPADLEAVYRLALRGELDAAACGE